jgi:small subunit ribosomal protein S18
MADEPVEKTTNTDDKEKKVSPSPRTETSRAETRPQQRPYRPSPGRRPDSRSRGGSRPGGARRFQGRSRYHRRKVCAFCADKTLVINWKRVENLRRFVGDGGSIYPRRKSGLCARHQRRVAVAIKRARHLAILPYTTEHVRIMSRG